VIGELHTASGKPVERRSPHNRVAQGRKTVSSPLVDRDEHDIPRPHGNLRSWSFEDDPGAGGTSIAERQDDGTSVRSRPDVIDSVLTRQPNMTEK
jgi:hypothetical protein